MISLPSTGWLELWVFVAVLSAGLRTAQATLSKWLTSDHAGLELAWATSVIGAVCLAPLALWHVSTTPLNVSPTVIGIAIVGGCIELLGLYMWLEALNVDDLSTVSPLRQTVPIFVVVLEPLVLSVAFDPTIALGAFLSAVGAYVVLVDKRGFLAPLARLSERGPQLALGAALVFAFASLTAKFVLASVPSPVFAFYVYAWLSLGFSAVLWRRDGGLPRTLLRQPRFIALGLAAASVSVTTFATFNLTPVVSQALVVFRASILFNIALGGLLFKEADLLPKLLGAALIIAGIAMTLF